MKLGWKTILGSVLAAIGVVAQQGVSVETITTGIGIILAGVGIRHAVAKRQ